MKKVLKWVLISIAVIIAIPLLVLILVLLCFPIRYKVFARADKSKDISVKVSYLLGIIRFNYSLKNETEDVCLWIIFLRFRKKSTHKTDLSQKEKTSGFFSFIQKNVKKEAVDKDVKSEKTKPGLKDILTFGTIKTIIKDGFKTIKKLFGALRPKYIDIEGEFGSSDPADTAILYGGYEAFSHMLGIREHVRLNPVFGNEAEVLRLVIDVRGRVNIYRLIIPVVRLLLTKPIRDLILKGDSDG